MKVEPDETSKHSGVWFRNISNDFTYNRMHRGTCVSIKGRV